MCCMCAAGVLQPWCVGACVDLMALAPSHDPKGLHCAVMHREAGHPTADPRHASINGRRVRSCSPFFGRSSAERGRGAAKQGCGHEGRGAGALRLCISQSTLASRSIARAARYCQALRSLWHAVCLTRPHCRWLARDLACTAWDAGRAGRTLRATRSPEASWFVSKGLVAAPTEALSLIFGMLRHHDEAAMCLSTAAAPPRIHRRSRALHGSRCSQHRRRRAESRRGSRRG